MKEGPTKVDTKEFVIPETVFSRDIESRVIQAIILHCLGKVEGIGLIGGNLIDTLFGRDIERVKGIQAEQDTKNCSVKVKVELNVDYGVSIPKKAEEAQTKIVEEITRLTGLHVSQVHLVIKGLNPPKDKNEKPFQATLLESVLEPEEIAKRF